MKSKMVYKGAYVSVGMKKIDPESEEFKAALESYRDVIEDSASEVEELIEYFEED